MPSRMTPGQLAATKGQFDTTNTFKAIAKKANGHGATRVEKVKADETLTRAVGKKKAAKLKEAELQRAGAKPKGLLRKLLG